MTYQLRQRRALLGEYWHRFLINRILECSGLLLLALALALALALGSYSPDDPGWFTATGAPPQNLVGSHGAMVASYLITTLGHAAFALVVYLLAWGVRLFCHQSPSHLLYRIWFFPIFLLLACAFLAAQVRPDHWQHHFGLGGIIGDTAFASMVFAFPSAQPTIDLFVRYAGYTLLVPLGLLSFGVTIPEVRTASLWLLLLPFALIRKRRRRKAAQMTATVALEDMVADGGASDADAVQRSRYETEDEESSVAPRRAPARKRRISIGRVLKGIGALLASDYDAPDAQLNQRRFATTTISKRRQPGPQLELMPEGFDDACGVLSSADLPQDEGGPRVVLTRQRTSRRAGTPTRKRSQGTLPLERDSGAYVRPSLDLLETPDHVFSIAQSTASLQQNARALEGVLEDYGVQGEIKTVRPGPVVTLYQLSPAPGLKTSRVMGLADDIARSMAALSARISTVPGESYIGIELPNATRETVYFKDLAARDEFSDSTKRLPIVLGKNIGGDPVIVDLASMPHLLIAGTTGSGKSVAINTMILSLLYSLSPEQCRLILVDPKMLELSVYEGIPHLMAPVVTDPKNAVAVLKWAVVEMESRYRKMSRLGVRNIDGYNLRMREAEKSGQTINREHQIGFDSETGAPLYETETLTTEILPYIVVVVDEMADLMIVAGKEIEACVQRLAQMARASGIHIILATQRPSVDVITGVIKANFPTRISFQVSQKVDSRTILGEQGAEQLLGMGDMLYMSGGGRVERVHGPFVSDREVEQVVDYLRSLGPPDYHPGILDGPDTETEDEVNQMLGLDRTTSGDDEYEEAVAIIMRDEKVSVSYLQRKMEIGYNKAARIVERMEEEGIVSPANHVGKREILRPQ